LAVGLSSPQASSPNGVVISFSSKAANLQSGPAEAIRQGIREAQARYYRLVLVVGPAGSGKTTALAGCNAGSPTPSLHLGSALGARLLELSRRQRALQVQSLLETLLDETGADPVALDNLEILFDPALQQDVLRLLQGLSRNRTLVAAWPGTYVDGILSYAEPGHPEHVRYPEPEAVIVAFSPPGTPTP